MDKETLERRYKEAKIISKHIEGVWDRLNKVPSFNGKADFMDRINRARIEAIVLRDNLNQDLSYWR